MMRNNIVNWLCAIIFIASTTACVPVLPPPATATFTPTFTPFLPVLKFTLTPKASVTASLTASLTPPPPTITPTPFPLPTFQANELGRGILPVNYVPDTCTYLYERWNLHQNSAPGTEVVPVMFHSINDQGPTAPGDTTISSAYFASFMEHAHALGFETMTTAQLVSFLENNALIPPRSMILIVDDRKRAQYFETFFEPYHQKYGWTVTNAWISQPETPALIWQENAALAVKGLVDFQAHGVIHNIPIDENAGEEFVENEIYGPLAVMEQHFGQKPSAFVWPRGLFTPDAVQIARQAGYRLGFTAWPRGPLLFNWIPLGALEQAASDPLMVLPRYWATNARSEMDKAVKISQEAQVFAEGNKALELKYYGQYCKDYPELK